MSETLLDDSDDIDDTLDDARRQRLLADDSDDTSDTLLTTSRLKRRSALQTAGGHSKRSARGHSLESSEAFKSGINESARTGFANSKHKALTECDLT